MEFTMEKQKNENRDKLAGFGPAFLGTIIFSIFGWVIAVLLTRSSGSWGGWLFGLFCGFLCNCVVLSFIGAI
jgi:hypothetical protein